MTRGWVTAATAVVLLGLAAPAQADKKLSVELLNSGWVSGGGLDCERTASGTNGTCEAKVDKGSTVVLTALHQRAGFGATAWTGCARSTATTCTVTTDKARSITVRFGDVTDPVVSSFTAPEHENGTATLTAQATDNDRVALVRFMAGDRLLDTDTTAPYEATLDTTQLPEGPARVHAVAVDASGRTATASRTVVVDRTAPVVTMAGLQGYVRSGGTITATVTDASPVDLFCVINNGRSFDCGTLRWDLHERFSPNSVFVRATDRAGNVGTGDRSFTIDDSAPGIEFGGGHPFFAGQTDGEVLVRVQDGGSSRVGQSGVATVVCRFDDEPAFDAAPTGQVHWYACRAQRAYEAMTEHVLRVTATDVLGNARSAEHRFTVWPPRED